MLYHSTGVTVFSVAMLFKETFFHPMDVAVFGVAMVLNETLLHSKDVTACSKRHYVFLEKKILVVVFVLLLLFHFFSLHVNLSFRGNVYL